MKSFNKKGMEMDRLVSIILFIIGVILVVILGIKVLFFVNESGNREFCALEGIKTQAQNIKPFGFFKTYEIGCRAQQYLLSTSALKGKEPSSKVLEQYGYSGGKIDTDSERFRFNVKLHFANQLRSCWDITGNRDVINFYATPAIYKNGAASMLPGVKDTAIAKDYLIGKFFDYDIVIGDATYNGRGDKKASLLKYYLDYDVPTGSEAFVNKLTLLGKSVFKVDQLIKVIFDGGARNLYDLLKNTYNTYWTYDKDLPAVVCMICSETYFDEDGQNILNGGFGRATFTNFLEKTYASTQSKSSLLSVLRDKKGDFPFYDSIPWTGQAVVYYQLYTEPTQERSVERTGVLSMPLSDVSNFCDVVVNQG